MTNTEIVKVRKADIAELKEMWRNEKVRIIKKLLLRGLSFKEIADILEIPEAVVAHFSNKMNKEEPKEAWEA